MKRCKKCGELKAYAEFHRASAMRDGYRSECKTCHQAQQKRWYRANREAVIAKVKRWQQENKDVVNARNKAYREANPLAMRQYHLRRTFGIEITDYERLLERQGGGCAICGRPPKKTSLHVDHDHESGVMRGLLCVGCNNALGQFRDSTDLLARASSYLTGDLLTIAAVSELDVLARERAGELARTSG